MKFKTSDIREVRWFDIGIDYGNGIKLVESGDWIQDGKYQYRDDIFEFQGKYYMLSEGRSGSPFTDWYYDSEDWGEEVDCPEVEKVEVKTHRWKIIK